MANGGQIRHGRQWNVNEMCPCWAKPWWVPNAGYATRQISVPVTKVNTQLPRLCRRSAKQMPWSSTNCPQSETRSSAVRSLLTWDSQKGTIIQRKIITLANTRHHGKISTHLATWRPGSIEPWIIRFNNTIHNNVTKRRSISYEYCLAYTYRRKWK